MNLHHAYAIVGERSRGRAHVEAILTGDLGMTLAANPDIRVVEMDTYSIDEARLLKSEHYLKPMGERAVHIVMFNAITSEAQQSLLKVTEEPVPNVHFFFILPTLQGILPTLRSRLMIVQLDPEENSTGKNSRAKKFLAATPAERLEMIAPLIEDKDKQAAIAFLNELEAVVPELIAEGKFAEAKMLGETIKMRGFLQGRSASVKMILEHVVLTMPVFAL